MISKLLLLLSLFFVVTTSKATTFPSVVPTHTKNVVKPKIKITTLENVLNRKLNGKEKVAYFLLKHKLVPKKLLQKKFEKEEEKAKKRGKRSLLFSILGWAAILIAAAASFPILSFVALALFIISIVNAIQSLSQKKKDNTNAILGLVFSALYFLFFFIGIIIVIALLA
jgi:hypothetical protein